MEKRDIDLFEQKVKSILEWSNIDYRTKDVLWNLMAEIVNLAKKISRP